MTLPTLADAKREAKALKKTLDPDGLMNPGKVIQESSD